MTITWGDGASVVFEPSDFLPSSGDLFTALDADHGTLRLDSARETIDFRGGNFDLGDLPEGPQPVTITIALGSDEREVSVRMVRKGKKLKY